MTFNFEQELHCLANHELLKFKEEMQHLYSIEFEGWESQRIKELMIDFYREADKLKCPVPQV